MKLEENKRYTSFAVRLYEEDYSDVQVCERFRDLLADGFISRYCIAKHTKTGIKSHYHVLVLCCQKRPSAIYELGFKESEISDVENRKSMYFYITKHLGKEEEDKGTDHKIEVLYDDIKYVNAPKSVKNASLSGFIDAVDEILREIPHISKIGLLRKLQSINEAYLGYYLRYYRFIEEIYGKALFELPYNPFLDLGDE